MRDVAGEQRRKKEDSVRISSMFCSASSCLYNDGLYYNYLGAYYTIVSQRMVLLEYK